MELIMRNFLIIMVLLSSHPFPQWEEVKLYPFCGEIMGIYLFDSLNIAAVFSGPHVMLLKVAMGAGTGISLWFLKMQIR
jgi:hypothetical protein